MKHSGPVLFGEVLFDCFPDGSRVLGGAPFNVAWHCQAFGLQPLFISRVGNDELGDEVRAAMQDWGMDTTALQTDRAHGTGVVDVSFRDGDPSYNIVENSAWDFIELAAIPEIDKQRLLYHGSLVMRNPVSANTLREIKQGHNRTIFIDVNLRPPWWDSRLIDNVMQDALWVKLNSDELALLVPQEQGEEARAKYLLSYLGEELFVVTMGGEGAMAINHTTSYTVQPDVLYDVVDTVGAGDAFSSVLLLGIHKGWSSQDMLERAQQFAGMVVGQHGAITRDKSFYQPFVESWGI